MPGSVTTSGGGGITTISAKAIEQGINSSTDIDAVLLKLDCICDALELLAVRTQPIPMLQPAIAGPENTEIETPIIPAPGAGRSLIIQFSGWFDSTPTNALIAVQGTDNNIYFKTPLVAAKIGLILKARIPEGIGCKILLSPGGQGVKGFLNYAVAFDSI
jgi:hypothetical protein